MRTILRCIAAWAMILLIMPIVFIVFLSMDYLIDDDDPMVPEIVDWAWYLWGWAICKKAN